MECWNVGFSGGGCAGARKLIYILTVVVMIDDSIIIEMLYMGWR